MEKGDLPGTFFLASGFIWVGKNFGPKTERDRTAAVKNGNQIGVADYSISHLPLPTSVTTSGNKRPTTETRVPPSSAVLWLKGCSGSPGDLPNEMAVMGLTVSITSRHNTLSPPDIVTPENDISARALPTSCHYYNSSSNRSLSYLDLMLSVVTLSKSLLSSASA